MYRRFAVVMSCLALSFVTCLSSAAGQAAGQGADETAALVLWTQGPMTRIFPLDKPPAEMPEAYKMKSARGEAEMMQIGVHTVGSRPTVLNGEVSDLTGPEGAVIPADRIDVLYADYVPVKNDTADQKPGDVEREAPAFFPDPLLPEWKLPRRRTSPAATQSIWVRVNVPDDAKPGDYHGTVTVSAGRRPGELLSGEVSLNLTVWDFALPRVSKFYMSNWVFTPELARVWEVEMFSEEHWKLIEMVADDMAYHRQNTILTPIFLLVAVHRAPEGGYSYTYDDLDRWIEMFLSKGFTLIEGKHVWLRPRTIQVIESDGSTTEVTLEGVDDPKFLEFIDSFFSSLWKHLGEKGLQGMYVQHIHDEPRGGNIANYDRLAKAIRAAAPGIKTIDALHSPGFAGLTDIPVPVESMYETMVSESGRSSDDIWMYYCAGPTGPWPNRFINYPLVRVRIFTWLCHKRGIPGFLHWGYGFWKAGHHSKPAFNPWDDTTANRWPCGDPLMVYPPRDLDMRQDILVPSIRWEIVREAVEDWEYLRMVSALADSGDAEAKALLDEIDEKAVPDWTTHTRDSEYLMSLRERMGEMLSAKKAE